MTQVEKIKKDIQDMETALAMPSINDMPKVKKRIETDLKAARAQLESFEKKSVEPSANQGQSEHPGRRLPTKEELEAWERGMEKTTQNQHRDQAESAKAFEPQRRVIAKIENPEPLTIPVVEIEFKDREGKPYTRAVDQDDIMALLKTYFKRVACSSMMESKQYSKAYDSDMGKMVYKLFQGWNTIYSDTGEGLDWPDLKDVFPNLGRASHAQKVNAEILYRWATNQKQPS